MFPRFIYLSLFDGSPKVQRNGLTGYIAVYRYGTPEVSRFFRLIAHRHDGALTGLYLIPSVITVMQLQEVVTPFIRNTSFPAL